MNLLMCCPQFLCLVVAVFCCGPVLAEEKRPNVVMIMIDDLGWMDLAVQGNRLVETPHLDRFAKQGVRFTNAYAAAPVCSPTRAAVMTGLAPARLQITNHIPDQARFTPPQAVLKSAAMIDHLPAANVTVAERLRDAGYRTAFLGKWHLSGRSGRGGKGAAEYYPENQGFNLNVGGCSYGGPPTFFDPYRIHNLPPRKKGEYLPDRLTDEAISFLRRGGQKPFFLCLWNYTVHWPMEAPQKLLDKYKDRKGRGLNDTRYGAMIEAMDASIGRLLGALDEMNLTKDTLVIFTSDNGGFSGVADNRPLRLGKGYLYEGGIRVPLMIRWPGGTRPGTVSHEPVVSMDFFPTMLEAASVKHSAPLDGVSLVNHLRTGKKLKKRNLYFHYPNYAWHRSNRLGSAVRSGDYKLIEYLDDGSVELYNLAKDLSEKKNLASDLPELSKQLTAKLHQWRKAVNASLPARN